MPLLNTGQIKAVLELKIQDILRNIRYFLVDMPDINWYSLGKSYRERATTDR